MENQGVRRLQESFPPHQELLARGASPSHRWFYWRNPSPVDEIDRRYFDRPYYMCPTDDDAEETAQH